MNELTVVSHPDPIVVARMIGALAETLGEPLSEMRLEGYLAALADVPTERLKLGLARAMRGATFFPKPAEIRRMVDQALDALATEARLAPKEDDDPRFLVFCRDCRDDGYVFVEGKSNTVRRCDCFHTNPKLVAQREKVRRYSYAGEHSR